MIPVRRSERDRGSASVALLVLMFAFTSLGVVWLARDVDRSISNRSVAQSVAFQAARSGAGSIDVERLRAGTGPALDADTARRAAIRTAQQLFSEYGLVGTVSAVDVRGTRVSVAVTVVDAGRTVSGFGAADAVEVRS